MLTFCISYHLIYDKEYVLSYFKTFSINCERSITAWTLEPKLQTCKSVTLVLYLKLNQFWYFLITPHTVSL